MDGPLLRISFPSFIQLVPGIRKYMKMKQVVTTPANTKNSTESLISSGMYGSIEPWDSAERVSMVRIMPAKMERELDGRMEPSRRPAMLT